LDDGQKLTFFGDLGSFKRSTLKVELEQCKGSECYTGSRLTERVLDLSFFIFMSTQEFSKDKFYPDQIIEEHFHLLLLEPGHNALITLRRDEVDTIDDIINPYAVATVNDFIGYSEKPLPVDLLHEEPSFM
jgi:hypothetical protein